MHNAQNYNWSAQLFSSKKKSFSDIVSAQAVICKSKWFVLIVFFNNNAKYIVAATASIDFE